MYILDAADTDEILFPHKFLFLDILHDSVFIYIYFSISCYFPPAV